MSSMGHLRGVDSNGEGLHHCGLIIAQRIGNRAATSGGHHQILRQRPWVSGATQEFLVAAGVLTSGEALVTFSAGNQRVNGHTLASLEARHPWARFQNRRGKLMPE